MPELDSPRISLLQPLVILLALSLGAAWMMSACPLLVRLVAFGPKEGDMGPSPSEEGCYPFWTMPAPMQGWTMPSLLVLESCRAAAALLAPLTAAVVLLRLRQRRLPIRHRFRQPGEAGCAAASVVLVIEFLNGLSNVLDRFDLYRAIIRCQSNPLSWIWQLPRLPPSSAIGRTVCSLGEHPGLAVAGAWFALAVSGFWRRGSDPIERLARRARHLLARRGPRFPLSAVVVSLPAPSAPKELAAQGEPTFSVRHGLCRI